MRHLLVGRRLLEAGAYLDVDTQRCGGYQRKFGYSIFCNVFRRSQKYEWFPVTCQKPIRFSEIELSLKVVNKISFKKNYYSLVLI